MRFISRGLPLLAFPCAAAIACNFTSGKNNGSDGGTVIGTQLDGSPPPAAGGTGAFGIVTVGGKQKMYLPQTSTNAAGHAYIAVVDVGASGPSAAVGLEAGASISADGGRGGVPALITNIDLGGPDASFGTAAYATATGGDSSMVIAVSTLFPQVWFIDPTTDTLVKTITLDSSFGQSNFSGGGGYVTGVAVDSANHRAILSVWNGFAIVDLTTQSITKIIEAPPSENFGFDSVHGRVLAPFYSCSSSTNSQITDGARNTPSTCPDGGVTAGLNVIDLSDGTVYRYVSPLQPDGGVASGIPSNVRFDPNNPVGSEPDSAAIDPTTGIAVVPQEHTYQNIIDFGQATFDKTAKTVTAPQRFVGDLSYSGVAVEYNKHLAFWEEESSSVVAVADLAKLNTGLMAHVDGTMPSVPGGFGFTNLFDPHGIAVTTALTTNGPVGFVVHSDQQWVGRIDLAAMLANQSADAGAVTLSGTQMAPYVTYLDVATKE